jgi:hypothetical protein
MSVTQKSPKILKPTVSEYKYDHKLDGNKFSMSTNSRNGVRLTPFSFSFKEMEGFCGGYYLYDFYYHSVIPMEDVIKYITHNSILDQIIDMDTRNILITIHIECNQVSRILEGIGFKSVTQVTNPKTDNRVNLFMYEGDLTYSDIHGEDDDDY